MAILNYTTKIAAHKTVAEIQRILATHGARSVMIDYAEGGRVEAVLFQIAVAGCAVHYRLPCNPSGVLAALKKQRVPRNFQTEEHAERVAWRIVKDWIEAQLALVEAGQAEMAEVFLPYASANGTTVYAMFQKQVAAGLLGPAEEW